MALFQKKHMIPKFNKMKTPKQIKMKISFLQRLKFAWYAFFLKDMHNIYPYIYYCATTTETGVCDNNKRISKCTNRIEVHLAQPKFKIEYSEALNYNVCKECADKYIGTFGENFNAE